MGVNYEVKQDIDTYVKMFKDIYEPIQNNERTFFQILARVLESVAKCSQFVNKHDDKAIGQQLPSLFSWYCSLVVKSNLPDDAIADAVWRKYPGVCPYCLCPQCKCARGKKTLLQNSKELERLAKENRDKKPTSLLGWQEMFADIYPRDIQSYDQKSNFLHLIEELGETAEAYRNKHFFPDSLENELTDVLTWIFGIANLLDAKFNDNGKGGYNLQQEIFAKFGGSCNDCKQTPCTCVPKQSNLVISERNYLIQSDIKALAAELAEFKQFFINTPDLKNFITNVKNTVEAKGNVTEPEMKEIVVDILNDKDNANWTKIFTAKGISENIIASTLFEIMKSGWLGFF